METLFLGMLLVFLDWNLTLGSAVIGLLPDFAGYILIRRGLDTLAGESPFFAKARPWAKSMAVYTGILYARDLFPARLSTRVLLWGLALVSLAVSLAISFWITRGVADLEKRYALDLRGRSLSTIWAAMAALAILSHCLSWLPLVGAAAEAAGFLVYVCYLVVFYQSKTRWEARG